LGKTKKTKNGGTIREAIKSIETIGERKTRKIGKKAILYFE
jgi:hypothetical protein